MQAKITITLVERLAHTKPEKRILVCDTDLKGFQVRQAPTGRINFFVRVSVHGRQRCPKIGSHPAMPVPMARARAAELLNAAQRGIDPTEAARRARGEITMDELWSRYLAELHRRGRAATTITTYTSRWTRYGSRLGKLRLSEVTYEKVAKLHDSITATAEADAVLKLLRYMLKWAMNPARKYLVATENVTLGVEMKHRRRRRRRSIDVDQVERLAEVMQRWRLGHIKKHRIVWFLELLALTGARRNEILAAKLEHLRDGDSYLFVPENKERNPEKMIVLGSAARAVIKEVRASAIGKYLFTSYTRAGQHIHPPYQQARLLFEEAGVPWDGFHSLRHTFASVARSRNLSLDDIAELLGHSDPAMTRTYATAYEEARRRHAEAIDRVIGGALGRPHHPTVQAKRTIQDRAAAEIVHKDPGGEVSAPPNIQPSKISTLLKPLEVGARLRRAVATLAKWRSEGQGPPYVRLGRSVLYDEVELEEWLVRALSAPGDGD